MMKKHGGKKVKRGTKRSQKKMMPRRKKGMKR